VLDSVVFGLQLTDFSLGRQPDGSWTLCKPTFGSANSAISLGDYRNLRINEWLADAQFAASHDFIQDLLPWRLNWIGGEPHPPGVRSSADFNFHHLSSVEAPHILSRVRRLRQHLVGENRRLN